MATAPTLTDGEPPRGLTVDQFLDWYEQQPGRYASVRRV